MLPLNWRTAEQYKFCKELRSKNQWAWQFLRRNKIYQEEWHKKLPLFLDERQQWYDVPEHKNNYYAEMGWPQLAPSEKEFMIPGRGAEKWGLFGYVNPQQDLLWKAFAKSIYHGHLLVGKEVSLTTKKGESTGFSSGNGKCAEVPEGKLAIIIEMEAPIQNQMKVIRETITFHQKNMNIKTFNRGLTKLNIFNWVNYLRILDAQLEIDARTIKTEEAAKIIFNSPDILSYRDKRAQAYTMRDYDYRGILLS